MLQFQVGRLIYIARHQVGTTRTAENSGMYRKTFTRILKNIKNYGNNFILRQTLVDQNQRKKLVLRRAHLQRKKIKPHIPIR